MASTETLELKSDNNISLSSPYKNNVLVVDDKFYAAQRHNDAPNIGDGEEIVAIGSRYSGDFIQNSEKKRAENGSNQFENLMNQTAVTAIESNQNLQATQDYSYVVTSTDLVPNQRSGTQIQGNPSLVDFQNQGI